MFPIWSLGKTHVGGESAPLAFGYWLLFWARLGFWILWDTCHGVWELVAHFSPERFFSLVFTIRCIGVVLAAALGVKCDFQYRNDV